jgi:hypothetical protein
MEGGLEVAVPRTPRLSKARPSATPRLQANRASTAGLGGEGMDLLSQPHRMSIMRHHPGMAGQLDETGGPSGSGLLVRHPSGQASPRLRHSMLPGGAGTTSLPSIDGSRGGGRRSSEMPTGGGPMRRTSTSPGGSSGALSPELGAPGGRRSVSQRRGSGTNRASVARMSFALKANAVLQAAAASSKVAAAAKRAQRARQLEYYGSLQEAASRVEGAMVRLQRPLGMRRASIESARMSQAPQQGVGDMDPATELALSKIRVQKLLGSLHVDNSVTSLEAVHSWLDHASDVRGEAEERYGAIEREAETLEQSMHGTAEAADNVVGGGAGSPSGSRRVRVLMKRRAEIHTTNTHPAPCHRILHHAQQHAQHNPLRSPSLGGRRASPFADEMVGLGGEKALKVVAHSLMPLDWEDTHGPRPASVPAPGAGGEGEGEALPQSDRAGREEAKRHEALVAAAQEDLRAKLKDYLYLSSLMRHSIAVGPVDGIGPNEARAETPHSPPHNAQRAAARGAADEAGGAVGGGSRLGSPPIGHAASGGLEAAGLSGRSLVGLHGAAPGALSARAALPTRPRSPLRNAELGAGPHSHRQVVRDQKGPRLHIGEFDVE